MAIMHVMHAIHADWHPATYISYFDKIVYLKCACELSIEHMMYGKLFCASVSHWLNFKICFQCLLTWDSNCSVCFDCIADEIRLDVNSTTACAKVFCSTGDSSISKLCHYFATLNIETNKLFRTYTSFSFTLCSDKIKILTLSSEESMMKHFKENELKAPRKFDAFNHLQWQTFKFKFKLNVTFDWKGTVLKRIPQRESWIRSVVQNLNFKWSTLRPWCIFVLLIMYR